METPTWDGLSCLINISGIRVTLLSNLQFDGVINNLEMSSALLAEAMAGRKQTFKVKNLRAQLSTGTNGFCVKKSSTILTSHSGSVQGSVKALAIDAFTLDWPGMIAYAYQPIRLIPQVLQHVKNQDSVVNLIAPFWPKRAWFTKLLSLTVDVPLILPDRKDLPKQPKSQSFPLGSMENVKQ